MMVGYARTSTVEQEAGLLSQIKELESAGCEKIFKEQASSVFKRNVLEESINFVREGDIFVITKMDRLARSVPDLIALTDRLYEKKVTFRILNIGIDTMTPTGKMMLTMLAAVAQFEREIMLERQKEGIAKAKLAGKFKGRKPLSDAIKNEVLMLCHQGSKKSCIAKRLGIAESSIYRIINEAKKS